jgi:hypothetical protein
MGVMQIYCSAGSAGHCTNGQPLGIGEAVIIMGLY